MTGAAKTTTWYADLVWLGNGGVEPGVVLDVANNVFQRVVTGVPTAPAGARRLSGITLPGLANAHSHCFHRALRGRAQADRGTFWGWRELMYGVADRLDPERYHQLARGVFAEMAMAGITLVGEFHYLHHGIDGQPYQDRNEMGKALIAAASDAGIRITLLDACYLTGGIDIPLAGVQRRFGDADADDWAKRVDELTVTDEHAKLGAAIHSVRAVPPDQIPPVVEWANSRKAPLHVHVSEQRLENEACRRTYDHSPTQLLAESGALGPRTVAVHATHVDNTDIALIGASGTGICMCPTTERDLGDGIGPARSLVDTGARLSVGSDSHAVIDLFEEARAVELDERLRTECRGHWSAQELLTAATAGGYHALGWPGGKLAVGEPADFIALDTSSVRWAGLRPEHAAEWVAFVGSAADVREVVVGGRTVVHDGVHQLVANPRHQLDIAIELLR